MKSKVGFLCLYLLLFPGPLHANDEVRNGADYNVLDEVAWFAANRPIYFCIDHSPFFGVELAKVRAATMAAIGKWREYLTTRSIFQNPRDNIYLSTNFQEIRHCRSADLQLIFGRNHRFVRKRINQRRLSFPLAFASLEAFDHRTGWGQGFIWIRPKGTSDENGFFPNWSNPELLEAIMLHEFGHVFGVGHISGTIMDKDIARLIKDRHIFNPLPHWMRLDKIDGYRELTPCRSCTYNLKVELTQVSTPEGFKIDPKVFKKLTGRLPGENVVANIVINPMAENQLAGEIEVTDDISREMVRIEAHNMTFFGGDEVFKAYKSGEWATFSHSGSVYQGTLKTPDNRSLRIVLNRNMEWGDRFHAIESKQGQVTKLFTVVENVGSIDASKHR